MVTSQNPKIPEMKPGYILRADFDEIDEFEERAKKFRIGDEDPTTFQLYRLSRGTYGQRQENNQMMRIKLPAGVVTADQMEASFSSSGVRGATWPSAVPERWASGAGRALRATLPLGVRGRASKGTKAEGSM